MAALVVERRLRLAEGEKVAGAEKRADLQVSVQRADRADRQHAGRQPASTSVARLRP